jgi:hypothetical protein
MPRLLVFAIVVVGLAACEGRKLRGFLVLYPRPS